jgi:phage tail sheath protein FI
MASTYKTPGVYVEEISLFPPSVAQVETAVPAFIGYTQKAEKNGSNLKGIPTRITSLLEFEQYFGKGYEYKAGDIKVVTDENNNYAVKSVTYINKVFYLYDSMRLFFDNGGGQCYIVSVNNYGSATFASGVLSSSSDLTAGLAAVEKYDEPTILLFPDAVTLGEASFYALQQAAIAQSAKLQDRVALLDLKENLSTWEAARDNFRDKIGINNLKYAVAYTPWLYNSYSRTIDFALFKSNVTKADGVSVLTLNNLTSDAMLNGLVTAMDTVATDVKTIEDAVNTLKTASFGTIKDNYNKLKSDVLSGPATNAIANYEILLGLVRSIADTFPGWRKPASLTKFKGDKLIKDLDAAASDDISGLRKYVVDLIKYEKNIRVDEMVSTTHDYAAPYDGVPVAAPNSWLKDAVATLEAAPNAIEYGDPQLPSGGAADDDINKGVVLASLADLDKIFEGLNNFIEKMRATAAKYKSMAQEILYSTHLLIGNIAHAIEKQLSIVPPSGPMAGVYAKVDDERGVWKAPANVSLSAVNGPVTLIDNGMQDDLNVDVNAGKSINAIRQFTGKGTLVWGARTLAGNDNEWRYISVRRFFNMVEESVKKASGQFVFEPNDANTWIKVKGMIENFLTVLWRQGALAGAKPEQAFFVKVGLGQTMTAQDILEGRMNVEIGMAAVRPAEFIILKFSHKMQES